MDECRVQSLKNVTSFNVWKGLGFAFQRNLTRFEEWGIRKDNLWRVVETGPSGPCYSIHLDSMGGRDAAHLIDMDDPDVPDIGNLGLVTIGKGINRKNHPVVS